MCMRWILKPYQCAILHTVVLRSLSMMVFHDYNFDLRCDSLAAPTAATAPAAATAPTTPTRPDGGWLHGQSILLATLLNLLVGKSSALKLDLEDLASHAPVLWK